ncbi:U3 snoRNP protein [Coemansia guatemalensis]|uniref:U3 snoRNP protein n=1 Tax=Coemansia guatemalensis TaxID=2761395 RepID=A0A9W8HYP6_9FUNG|nr:U3 snoRNP protein [Coemansia guatemalensis]
MKDAGIASQLNTAGGDNTYRFKSFKQRADEIEINVSRRIVRDFDEPDEHGSYFSDCLRKWGELNCTNDFSEFLRRVRNYQRSLAQVLYHKDEIICTIEEYLSMDHVLVVEAILDLATSLARDLQEEVLPYYERLVRRIMPLIKSDVAEVVEAACDALAYLFKYLAKSLVADLRPTFNLVSPMLGVERQKANVRRFMAESMSFLIRKLRGDTLQQFVEHVVHALLECPPNRLDDFRDGIGLLFFECMRNVETQLHSRAPAIMTALLRELYKEEPVGGRLEDNNVYVLVALVTKLCLHYTKRESSQRLWSVLLAEYDAQAQALIEQRTERAFPFACLLGLLKTATVTRKGSRVAEYKALLQRCKAAFAVAEPISSIDEDMAGIVARERLSWLIGLLLQCDLSDMVSTGKVLLDIAFSTEPLAALLSMAQTLARLEWSQWNQIILPYLVRLTVSRWESDRTTLLMFWAELFHHNLFDLRTAGMSSVVTTRGQVLFPTTASSDGSAQPASVNISQALIEWLAEPIDWEGAISQQQSIPADSNTEFKGFDADDDSSSSGVDSEDDQAMGESDAEQSFEEVAGGQPGTDVAIKLAILNVLSHISVDPLLLLNGLDTFADQLISAITNMTSQLARAHPALQQNKFADNGPADDDVNEALGIPRSSSNSCLYWGAYHQPFPLVSLLGRVLQLKADVSFHAPPQLAAEQLMAVWCRTWDSILPVHTSNSLLIEGLYKVANALKHVTSAKGRNGEQASAAIRSRLSAALSLQQLEDIMPFLERNLGSMHPSLRLETLQLLSLFDQPAMASTAESAKAAGGVSITERPGEAELCTIIHMGIELESTVADLSSYKDRMNHLRRMAVIASSGRIPELLENVFPLLAVAQFSVNFSLVWPETVKQLGLLAGANSKLFWRAVWGLLQQFSDERQLIETGPTPAAKRWLNERSQARASQEEFVPQPKLDGHAAECPNLARFERICAAESLQFNSAEGVTGRWCYLMADSFCPDRNRVDYANVRKQLLKALAEVGASTAEAHAKPVVHAFLDFMRSELGWTKAFFEEHGNSGLDNDAESGESYIRAQRGLLVDRSRRLAESVCALWLKLFSKFRNPHQLPKSPLLRDLFLRMLARGDNVLQRHALDCLLTWRQSEIQPYADNLRSLLDEKRFRDELRKFDLSVDGESVNIVHRAQLMPVVLRILHGQMMVHNAKSSRKDGMKIRRSAVLGALVGISPQELQHFVGIGLETFRATIARSTPRELLEGSDAQQFSLTYATKETNSSMDVDSDDDDAASTSSVSAYAGAGAELDDVSPKALVSYFNMLLDMIRQLGLRATPVFHESLAVMLSSVSWAQRQIDTANDDLERLAESHGTSEGLLAEDDGDDSSDSGSEDCEADADQDGDDSSTDGQADDIDADRANQLQSARREIEQRKSSAREVRQLALKCLVRMFMLQPSDFDFGPYMQCIYEAVIDPRIDNLAAENTQGSTALLQLLKSWSQSPRYFSYLVDYNPLTVRMLLDILVAPKVQPAVVTLVLDIIQVLLDYSPEEAVENHGLSAASAEECAELVRSVLQKHVSQILSHMRVCFSGAVLASLSASAAPGSTGSNNLLMRQIHILSRVAEYATKETKDAKALLELLLPMLKRPNAVVSERAKGDVLKITLRFIPLVLDSSADDLAADEQKKLLATYLSAISSCFSRMRLDSARATLSQILTTMAQIDRKQRAAGPSQPVPLETAATIIGEINAYSAKRLDEPDHDRRLAAYGRLNEELWSKPDLLDAYAWIPILQNLTYFTHDQDELSTRANAAFGLSRFISRVAEAYSEDPTSEESRVLGRNMVSILLPAIKYALAAKHEIIKIEFLAVLRKAVRECGKYFDQLRDLATLDTSDEEANFFYNILHIQTHRRMRAIRRLRELLIKNVQAHADRMDVDQDEDTSTDTYKGDDDQAGSTQKSGQTMAAEGKAMRPLVFNSEQASPISPTNIRTILFPLLENWALADGAQLNHDLANESIQTIGAIGAVLPWSQYNAVLRKYLGVMKKKPELEKRLMRLVMALLDNFHFDLRHVKVDKLGNPIESAQKESADSSLLVDATTEGDEAHGEDGDGDNTAGQTDVEMLQDERIHDMVVNYLLPELKKKISDADEDKMVLRAPIAMAVVRILTALPENTMGAQLPRILTTICNMLRAKAQSARNATRDTLIRIVKFLGPSYFGFLVKELTGSLSRGAQKHILSYTIYTLLKEMVGMVSVGDLDYTLEPIIEILVQDVFGQTGEDKDAEEWTTKIREAKVHHGPDCFEILASVTHFDNIRLMLAPLRDILRETDTPKRTKVVDEVLRRISIGLNHNKSYNSRAVLVFCHGIISQYLTMSTTDAKDTQQRQAEVEQQKRLRFKSKEDEITVHVKRKDVAPKRDYLQANAHRFVQFGLEVVYFGLRRERFDAKDGEILGMLDPFVDLAGNGLFSRYNSIITLCCKIWTLMVRLPLPSIAEGIPAVIQRLFNIFRQSPSTNSEMIQNCFKLLAALLRSKHAETLMADYRPEELVAPEKPEQHAEDKGKKAKKGRATSSGSRASAECMKKSLLGEEQLRDLIDFIRPDIEEPERQATAFSLIRAILTRRMIVDSLYTLLDSIRELMISAQAANVREHCRLTWFHFLMDYPLGERRLTNAMSFLVQNASSYAYESGRVSALEVMGVIISRFTDELLLPNAAEPFFLGMVLIIAKDESSQCREMAAHLLPRLISRFDQPRLKRAWMLLDKWSAGTANSFQLAATTNATEPPLNAETRQKQAKMRELGRAALQCYGIIIEPLGDRFQKQLPAFLASVDSGLSVSLRTWKEAEGQLNHTGDAFDLEKRAANLHSGDDPHDSALVYWETAYMALNSYARLVKATPQRAFGTGVQSRIWQLAARHLTHPHAWVRLASSRLIGAYVAMAEPSWMLDAESNVPETSKHASAESLDDWEVPEHRGNPKHVLLSVANLRQIANGLVVQLNSRFLSDELGNQVVKNLYFIAKCFLTAVPEDALAVGVEDKAGAAGSDSGDASDSDNDEEDHGDDDVADADGAAEGSGKMSKERCLSWLINRVGSLARTEIIRGRGAVEKRTYCFRWFAAVISLVPPALLVNSAYIMPMISPLYRTTEDDQLAAESVPQPDGTTKTPAEQLEEIKGLANEVIRLLQNRIGVTAFSAVLAKVQKHVSELRSQRRVRRKQLAVIDPELHAQKKMRKHANVQRRRQERNSEQARKKVRTVVRRAYGASTSS